MRGTPLLSTVAVLLTATVPGCGAGSTVDSTAPVIATTPVVVRPAIRPIWSLEQEEWLAVADRWASVLRAAYDDAPNPSIAAHVIRLEEAIARHGPGARLRHDGGLWQHLTDGATSARIFGEPIAHERPYGIVYHTRARTIRGPHDSAETHEGQIVGLFAELGTPVDRPLAFGHGGTIADAARGVLVQVTGSDLEMEWISIVAAAYAHRADWTNRWGDRVGIASLVAGLTTDDEGSCGGMHRLQAVHLLRAACRARGEVGWDRFLPELDRFWRARMAAFWAAQSEDGSWARGGVDRDPRLVVDLARRVVVTGHALELLAGVEGDDMGCDDWEPRLSTACDWLWPRLRDLAAELVVDWACPVTHAICGLGYWLSPAVTGPGGTPRGG